VCLLLSCVICLSFVLWHVALWILVVRNWLMSTVRAPHLVVARPLYLYMSLALHRPQRVRQYTYCTVVITLLLHSVCLCQAPKRLIETCSSSVVEVRHCLLRLCMWTVNVWYRDRVISQTYHVILHVEIYYPMIIRLNKLWLKSCFSNMWLCSLWPWFWTCRLQTCCISYAWHDYLSVNLDG